MRFRGSEKHQIFTRSSPLWENVVCMSYDFQPPATHSDDVKSSALIFSDHFYSLIKANFVNLAGLI